MKYSLHDKCKRRICSRVGRYRVKSQQSEYTAVLCTGCVEAFARVLAKLGYHCVALDTRSGGEYVIKVLDSAPN
ncbi:MAG TPA: hypothetical protein VII92_16685 [Anaerolineae bacterium]